MPVLSGVTAALLEAGQGTKADPESGSGVSSGRGGQLSASAGLGLLMSVMEPTGTGTDTELRASPVNGAVVAETAPLEEVVESEVGVKPVGDGAVEGGDESPKDTSHLETTRQLSSETATDALPTEQSHTPRTIPFQPGGFRAKKPAVVPSLPLQNLSPATPSRQQPTHKTFQAEVGPPVSGTHNFTSMGSSPRTVVSSSGTARVTATVRPKRTQRGAVTDRL